MLRKLAVVLTGLMFLATVLQAQDSTEKKAKAKKKVEGTPYKVVSVNADAKTIKVKSEDGTTKTLNIGAKTTILGPNGGKKNDGLKDERLIVGSTVRVVMDGKDVKTLYLPRKQVKPKQTKPEKVPAKPQEKTN